MEGAKEDTSFPVSELVMLEDIRSAMHWYTSCRVERDRPGRVITLHSRGRSFSQLMEQMEVEDLSRGSTERRADSWSCGEERRGSKVERWDCKEVVDTLPADTSFASREGCMVLGTPRKMGQISTDILL